MKSQTTEKLSEALLKYSQVLLNVGGVYGSLGVGLGPWGAEDVLENAAPRAGSPPCP